jgi:hypothetical protein
MVVGSKFKHHVQPIGVSMTLFGILQIFGAIKNKPIVNRLKEATFWVFGGPNYAQKKLSTSCSCIAMEEVYSLNKEDDT